jgi:hypothetical protein
VKPGTFRKKMSGADPVQPEDIFHWILYLGRVELWPAPGNLEELLPA